MPLPTYPGRGMLPGLSYSSRWSPTFFNQTATGAAGADVDVAIAQYPLHDFELSYAFLRDGPSWGEPLAGLEFRTMMGFFLQMGGARGRFLYRNPDDAEVFQNPIGLGDGTTTTFLLTRTFGANGYFGTEPVGQADTFSPLNVYLGGSASPANPASYSVSTATPCANTVTFASPPAAGQAIAVDMSYYYYCKLADNSDTFEKFMGRLWSASKIKLHSCRAGA